MRTRKGASKVHKKLWLFNGTNFHWNDLSFVIGRVTERLKAGGESFPALRGFNGALLLCWGDPYYTASDRPANLSRHSLCSWDYGLGENKESL